jgi:hypothetical protein
VEFKARARVVEAKVGSDVDILKLRLVTVFLYFRSSMGDLLPRTIITEMFRRARLRHTVGFRNIAFAPDYDERLVAKQIPQDVYRERLRHNRVVLHWSTHDLEVVRLASVDT